LSIHGEGLAQFKLAKFGRAALIAPIRVRDQPIGVICVSRKEARPFSERDQAMLEAVADYASISLVNARLFQALEARARRLQEVIDEAQAGIQNRMLGLAGAAPRLQSLQDEVDRLMQTHPGSSLQEGLGRIRQEISVIARQLAEMLERHDDKNRPGPTASS
jgi:GAF domain-containing protein